MKKKIVYFISVLLTCTCLNRGAQAFIWPDLTPLIPFSPQFCVMCIPPAIGMLYSTIDQVQDAKNRLKEMTDVTKIKQKFASYAAGLGNTALNYFTQKLSAKRKVAAASRTIMESKREGVDIRKEESIRADFINLFLQYPSDKAKIKAAYKRKGNDLKLDMALEMYITASEMYKDLCGESGKGCEVATKMADNPDIDVSAELSSSSSGKKSKSKKKGKQNENLSADDMRSRMGTLLQLSLMESCIMEGNYCGMLGMMGCEPSKDGGGSAEPSKEQPTEAGSGDEDKVCHWKSAVNVALAYDKIMKDNEYLIQMQHQYEAVLGIDTIAKIKSAEEKQTDKITSGLKSIGEGLDASACQACKARNGGSVAGCMSVCK